MERIRDQAAVYDAPLAQQAALGGQNRKTTLCHERALTTNRHHLQLWQLER
jgi:hypothetical protein